MRGRAIGNVLLASGLLLGCLTVLALFLGLDPTHLSPFLVRVALYKLTFLAVVGMLFAGALMLRRARRGERT